MAEPVVLQKLLTAGLAGAVVDGGLDRVGGYVALAADVAHLATPTSLLATYGYDQAPEFVDVVRFVRPPAAILRKPSETPERSWTTYPTGFLRDAVPVWLLETTRWSYGAEYWRLRADGQQQCLASYDGCARGWRGAHGWSAPSRTVGTRARHRDVEYAADVVGDGVLLTAGGAAPPPGLADARAQEIRPGVWSAAVPLGECEVFEVHITALADDVAVRVLDSDGTDARVELRSDDAEQARRLGATLVEPDRYEAFVPVSALTRSGGVLNEMVPPGHVRQATPRTT